MTTLPELKFAPQVGKLLNLPLKSVQAALALLHAGNTVPFIARYRKEAIGELDEEALRQIELQAGQLQALDERRQTVLGTIDSQGKLTPSLQAEIEAATTRTDLEDLYQPYKPKRRTRASIARERGLEGLADLIIAQPTGHEPLSALARPYISESVKTTEDAWAGARDIVAERISDDPAIRREVREKALTWAKLICIKIPKEDDPREVYKLYYSFNGRVDQLRAHQILAINRGEKEKILRVQLQLADRDWQGPVQRRFKTDPKSKLADQLEMAAVESAKRLLLPAIERDVRRYLTENAASQAIRVFAENLRALLMQRPLSGHIILGIDPGFRTGCKIAVVDGTGKVLATATIYPHPPQRRKIEAQAELWDLIERYQVSVIAIGNGTASRETEEVVADLIRKGKQDSEESLIPGDDDQPGLQYLIVNEAGASVYSASPLARSELPDMDVSLRGAVSIARRVQDPLAELVKIDPKSIGVGMYQHDVDQKDLAATLTGVVESVVNQVGVDLNTASPALMTYIAGIGPQLADQIVQYRGAQGPFRNRADLSSVPGVGPKTFEQAAGFLRIHGGLNPLDSSAIHPESYPAAEAIIARSEISLEDPLPVREKRLESFFTTNPPRIVAEKIGVGLPTLQDIREQLIRPGRDPRADLSAPALRTDVLTMKDLVSGMILEGTVRNVVDFGAFVDIGVKKEGLLHRSEMPRGTQLHAGQVIFVEVLRVDMERGRIGLGLRTSSGDLAYN